MTILYRIEDYFLWLMFYSFAGWVYETILCSVAQKKLVKRGFLFGPLCPIYGCGAVLIILVLGHGTDNPVGLFLSGAMLTCTLEYITSYGMEKLFHARWWDYSKRRFNLNGRVCLAGAVVFGTFSVLLLRWIHPAVSGWMAAHISPFMRHILCAVLLALLVTDCVLTVQHLLSFNERLKTIQTALEKHRALARAEFEERFEDTRFYQEHLRPLLDAPRLRDRRLLHSFPHLTSTRYHEALEKVRERAEAGKNRKSRKI